MNSRCVTWKSVAICRSSSLLTQKSWDFEWFVIVFFICYTVRLITVFIQHTLCRCDWRSQKLGVHWASQSSSFWQTKIRNINVVPYLLVNERETKNPKRVLWPILWTTWLNGIVRMMFRKKWILQKVKPRIMVGKTTYRFGAFFNIIINYLCIINILYYYSYLYAFTFSTINTNKAFFWF